MAQSQVEVKLHALIAELKLEAEKARVKLGSRADELLADLEVKLGELDKVVDGALDEFAAEVVGEVAEYKAVGPVAWVKSNPMTAAGLVVGLVAAVNGVLALFGLHFGL